MSVASTTAYNTLQQAPSLKYGDYDVTKDWNYFSWNSPDGQKRFTYLNPTNNTQNFTLDYRTSARDYEQLTDYLGNKDLGRQWALQNGWFSTPQDWSADVQGYQSRYLTPTNRFSGFGAVSSGSVASLSQLAEQKRLQDLTNQALSGQMSVQQSEAAANNPALRAQLPKTVYQQAYDTAAALPKPPSNLPPVPGSGANSLLGPSANSGDLQSQYANLLNPSSDENDIQNHLNNLYSSRDLGIENVRQQPMATPFIAGQSAAVERMANLKVETLQRKLALAQAKRQSALDATKFSLDRSDRQAQLTREDLRYNQEVKREQDRYNQELAQQQQKERTSRENAAQEFAIQNQINKPFYMIGNTVYRTADNKAYSTPDQFFADGGARDWSNVQTLKSETTTDKLLSVTEAARLGVPYGTTQQQAIALQQTPSFGRTSSSSSGSGGSSSSKALSSNDAAIRNWILANKRENPNIPYYELWGQLTEELKGQQLNPSNYDKLFWEILHPEGLAGYTRYTRS